MHPLPKFFASRSPLEIPTKSVNHWKKPHENTALPFHGNFLKMLAALLLQEPHIYASAPEIFCLTDTLDYCIINI